jgi:hypothetical protein
MQLCTMWKLSAEIEKHNMAEYITRVYIYILQTSYFSWSLQIIFLLNIEKTFRLISMGAQNAVPTLYINLLRAQRAAVAQSI